MTIATSLEYEELHDIVLKELERDAAAEVDAIIHGYADKSPIQLLEMQNRFELLAALNVVIRFYGGDEVEMPSYSKLGDRLAKLRESKP